MKEITLESAYKSRSGCGYGVSEQILLAVNENAIQNRTSGSVYPFLIRRYDPAVSR
jgi:hypothetical protein